jgi:uncharacterized protein
MSEHFLGNAATVELKANAAAGGTAPTAERDLTMVSGAAVGVWEVQPGELGGTASDEAFVILSGSATLTFPATGEVVTVGPGDIVKLNAGESVRWQVHELLRKVYAFGTTS